MNVIQLSGLPEEPAIAEPWLVALNFRMTGGEEPFGEAAGNMYGFVVSLYPTTLVGLTVPGSSIQMRTNAPRPFAL